MKKVLLSVVLGLGMLASFAQNSISNVSFSGDLIPGEDVTVTFDCELAEAGWLQVIFGESLDATTNDFASKNWNVVYAVNSWQSVKNLTAGTHTGVTATFTVPNSTPSTAAAELKSYVMRAVFRLQKDNVTTLENGLNKADFWITTQINAPANSGEVSSFSIEESVLIGSDLDVYIDYNHDYPVDKEIKILLVKATIGGDILWDKGTFGYAAVTVAATTPVTKKVALTVKEKNDNDVATVTSANLEEGQEWRVVVQFLDVSQDKAITLTKIVNNLANITPTTNGTPVQPTVGDNLDVNFDYQLEQDSKFEISVVKFKDGVEVVPQVLLSNVFVSNTVSKSTTATNTASEKYTVTIKSDAIPVNELASGETYRVVVKVLDATTNDVLLQSNTLTAITKPSGLFDFAKVELLNAFPNPASSVVNFTQRLTNVVVLDATGMEVEKINSATELNVSSYKSGIYLIKAEQGIAKVIVK